MRHPGPIRGVAGSGVGGSAPQTERSQPGIHLTEGILLLVAPFDRVPFHREQCGNRADRDLHPVGPARGHGAGDGDHLVEAERKVGTVRALDREVADQGADRSSRSPRPVASGNR